jgi:hypothetical protein
MLPSEETIAAFISFAPNADEGTAFVFLEVRHLYAGRHRAYQPPY